MVYRFKNWQANIHYALVSAIIPLVFIQLHVG